MARLYANENFPQPVVVALCALGHEVLTVLETGKSGQAWPDEAVLAFATQERLGLLTLNRKHFIKLHGAAPGHSGIIVCTFDRDFLAQAKRIDESIKAEGDLNGKLVRGH